MGDDLMPDTGPGVSGRAPPGLNDRCPGLRPLHGKTFPSRSKALPARPWRNRPHASALVRAIPDVPDRKEPARGACHGVGS
jgi:hypothetical protein